VSDYYRLVLMLLSGGELDGIRLLKAETVRMMTSNQVGSKYPFSGFGWGFGMRVRTDIKDSAASFGWSGGTGTQFEVDPGSRIIAIIFAPTRPGTPGVVDMRNEFISKAMAAVGN